MAIRTFLPVLLQRKQASNNSLIDSISQTSSSGIPLSTKKVKAFPVSLIYIAKAGEAHGHLSDKPKTMVNGTIQRFTTAHILQRKFAQLKPLEAPLQIPYKTNLYNIEEGQRSICMHKFFQYKLCQNILISLNKLGYESREDNLLEYE
ncbi:hypothetical protein ACFE04_023262 [Oxalis oulophora]